MFNGPLTVEALAFLDFFFFDFLALAFEVDPQEKHHGSFNTTWV